MIRPPEGTNDDKTSHHWLDDDVTALDDQAHGSATNLVSLGFLAAALRRSAWFSCLVAVVGLLVGSGLYLKAIHTYQATTTLLLTVGPEPQPGTAILAEQAIAQSHAVARLTVKKLGLRQNADSFLQSCTITPLTDRVLQVTVSASSSDEAVRRASALAAEFLTFRAGQLRAEQRLEIATLEQQIAQDKQHLTSITKRISLLSAQPPSTSGQAELRLLRPRADSARGHLTTLEQAASNEIANTKLTTATMIGGSGVLDPASPVAQHSRVKRLVLYGGGGLIVGLILAMSFVVIRALLSERLRRRDDVAQALRAPVRSVPAVRARHWLPGVRTRALGHRLERIVGYLRDAMPAGSRCPVALAIVPVGEQRVAARSVASLARSCAQDGARVVVADLSGGAKVAALLGAKGPGVCTVSAKDADVVVAVPDPAEFAPAGPLKPAPSRAQSAYAEELAAACTSADLLLTLIPLDPSVGGEHLATWASDAVVMVTAGKSSWTKIQAVGEMIRQAGTRLLLAVLVGADGTDESLGATGMREAGRDAVLTWGTQAGMEPPFAVRSSGRMPHDSAVSAVQLDPSERLRAGE